MQIYNVSFPLFILHSLGTHSTPMYLKLHVRTNVTFPLFILHSLGTHLISMYLKLYVKTNIVVTLDKVWRV